MENKLKILCLHGFRQNGNSFKQKLGSFRKILKPHADFYFLNAPHIFSEPADAGNQETEERSWWFTSEDRTYVSKFPSDCSLGFEESVKSIQSFVTENGPFDGLMGFSQGATMAAIICSMITAGKFDADFKFVILVAGFKSLCSQHSNFYNVEVNIPCLHVVGDTDNVISKERSAELFNIFRDSKFLKHPGGHYVPASKEYKELYTSFILKYIVK